MPVDSGLSEKPNPGSEGQIISTGISDSFWMIGMILMNSWILPGQPCVITRGTASL